MTTLFQKGEDMATNILLVNQKGGVGKTTFADEIAWGLERRGHKVGFGNLDPQGGANHEKNLLDDEDAVNVIDTPGFLSDDTAEYAKNADIAIIPVQPGTLGLKPMKRTIKVITEANPDLSFAIIVNNFAGIRQMQRLQRDVDQLAHALSVCSRHWMHLSQSQFIKLSQLDTLQHTLCFIRHQNANFAQPAQIIGDVVVLGRYASAGIDDKTNDIK